MTNGIARVLLYVPLDNLSTLYYFFYDPNSEVHPKFNNSSQLPKTSLARTLCLCLMAFRSPTRGQEWRNAIRPQLPPWTTTFDYTRSEIPEAELQQTLIYPDNTILEYTSPEYGSSYEPPSSPLDSQTATTARQVPTRSQAGYAPLDVRHRSQSPDSSGSDSNEATGHKRGSS